jgi:hypothetical protein
MPRITLIPLLLLAFSFLSSAVQGEEYILVSGGPAMRQWENLRIKNEQHDRWWGNFIATAMRRVQDLKKERPGVVITWMVYRPAYERRTLEDRKPYTTWIAEKPAKYGLNLRWFNGGAEVINYINSRSRGSVVGFEYFGHSNKFCFMFDYSSDLYGSSASWLHQNDLRRLRSAPFARNAYCHSWGCHTAEAMSAMWKAATGLWLVGAYGKTDYSDLHLRDNRVGLSSGSHWRRG